MEWQRDESAPPRLEALNGPFAASAFRRAFVETVPGWRDATVGFRAADGTVAAVPLLRRGSTAEAVPPSGYGGIVSTRALDLAEQHEVFAAAFSELGVRAMEVRSLELDGRAVAGEAFAVASVVTTSGADPRSSYARIARRSLGRAVAAGCEVVRAASPADFWSVYDEASAGWRVRYPQPLVFELVKRGAARVDAVRLGDRFVAALLTLVGGAHWMCWLAGQAPAGREVAASYLAYDAVFADAHEAGVPFVNLGASVAGGAEFKSHLGAVARPLRSWRAETGVGTALRVARRASARAIAVIRPT